MLDLPIEPTDDLAKPAFKDRASCEAWLHQLQLTNLHQAHGVLRLQLDEFNRYPMRGADRLQTLELLRETVVQVQSDYAKKLISKHLPLNDDELTIFVALVGLWKGLMLGYQRCLQTYIAGDKSLADSGALIAQRALRYAGMQIFEHLRTGYEFDTSLWHQLHSLFAFAEEQGFHQTAVDDALHTPNLTCTCQTVYIKTLLSCHSRPVEMTRGQLQLLDRWLNQWHEVLLIDRHCLISKNDAPPLAVDLAGTHGLQSLQRTTAGDSVRYLSMVPLSKLLRVKTILLQQGQTPQQLELGNDSNSTDCAEFLNRLHRNFCEAHTDRLVERHTIAQSAELCFGIDGIYAHIARKPFRQPKKDAKSDDLARKQIAAFGRVLSETNRHDVATLGFVLETWKIENESIAGARLLRDSKQGGRLGSHQLVALKTSDAKAFMLGKVSWLLVARTGLLRMGIQYFPGVAQAIAIKGTGINATLADKSDAALYLPDVPALKTPPSLIVPRDFFRANRVIEITHLDGTVKTVKLGFSVDKGADFERVSFTPA